jgi:hypothetical protein
MHFVMGTQLCETARLGTNQVIGQVDIKGFIANRRPGTEHRMPEPERLALADIDAGHAGRQDRPDDIEQILLARNSQRALKLRIAIEMIFDRPLAAARDKHQTGHTRLDRLFNRILDQRFVDDGHHLLGHGLGCGQKARAPASNGKDGSADWSLHVESPDFLLLPTRGNHSQYGR